MIDLTSLMSEEWFVKAWEICKSSQQEAIAPITGTKVGAVSFGLNEDDKIHFTRGSNLEISISKVYHAEEIALISMVRNGIKPLVICCTSKSDQEHIAMCGDCRQLALDINYQIKFVIFNPDGSVKFMGLVKDFIQDNKSWGKIDWSKN